MQKVTQAKSLLGTDGAVPENPKQQEAECPTETARHHRSIRVETVVCRALVRDLTATDSNRTNRWSGQASMVGDPKSIAAACHREGDREPKLIGKGAVIPGFVRVGT
jgi:hypothetical protein